MVLDSGWLLLSDAVDRLSAARNVREDQAKLDICAAIAELRLRIRAHAGDDHAPKIAEINDIEISDKLTPDRIDWALSRPALLHPWRTRSTDGWQERPLTLIEACVEDFTTELCGDISSVPLPRRQSIPAQVVTYPDRLQYARELARAEWSPCPGTIEELSCLVGNVARTIPLAQALSIMAFGSTVDPVELDEVELVALRQQAASALCDAALMTDVAMFGSRLRPTSIAQPISEIIFRDLPCMGDAPNSLVRDHESRASWSREIERSVNHDKHERGWDGDWFNVEVEVTSFMEWLHLSIASTRRKQLGRKLSRRLFEYPFWSIETVLCWITVRDANRLQENLLSASPWHRPDTNVESQAEMRLLRMLKDGKLKAQVNGQVLPCGYWTDCVPIAGDLRSPIVGDLSADSPSLRLPREDVLRIFPEALTRPCSYVRARRQARIDRVIQRMRATRQWISCAEIADWSARNIPRPVDRQSRRSSTFDRLESTFAAGGFRLGGKSQLCFLSPDTSVVRLSFEPVDRTIDADGFRPASVSVPRFLERCWLPNEMCRAWFKQQQLDWPLHFETTLREANETPKTKQQPEVEAEKRVGRPPLIQNYVDEFERVLKCGSLSPTLKQERNKLGAWGRKNLDEKKRLSAGTLENYIRDRLKSWNGQVPWKTK